MTEAKFVEGDLVAVSLQEKGIGKECFGRCLGLSAGKYLVNVFGEGLRTIDPSNPYYPTMSKIEGDRLEPRTDRYLATPDRRIAVPRFEIERDEKEQKFHLLLWKFACADVTMWHPYDQTISTTIDAFVIRATGSEGALGGTIPPWTVFVTKLLEAAVVEGEDPFKTK